MKTLVDSVAAARANTFVANVTWTAETVQRRKQTDNS